MRNISCFILLSITICSVSACGIKPKSLDAPNAQQADEFPHIYPHTSATSK